MRLVLWCALLLEMLHKLCSGFRLVSVSTCIMALMFVYEGLGLLIARDTY